MITVPPGKYTFRFNGHSINPSEKDPYVIVGVGIVTIDAERKIRGFQMSNITRIIGQGAAAEPADFGLDGFYAGYKDEMSVATITFTSTEQTMIGKFAFVPAGGTDRFWLISTTSEVILPEPYTADEVVCGEFLRLPD